MHRRLLQIEPAAAARSRRLCIGGNDLVTSLGKRRQRRHRKFRRTHEDDAK
jgi:citrate lyase beta subunit